MIFLVKNENLYLKNVVQHFPGKRFLASRLKHLQETGSYPGGKSGNILTNLKQKLPSDSKPAPTTTSTSTTSLRQSRQT